MIESETGGYAGNILQVDLSSGEIKKEPLDMKLAGEFLGGLGMSVKLAYDMMQPGIDPLSPANPIIIGAGPLVGTFAPGSSRVFSLTRLPANNSVGWGGAGGMSFGCMLKNAGYDHVIVTGRANNPVYLNISDDDIEICDAASLWGKTVNQTSNELCEKHGRPLGVTTIGQGGENLVKFSMAFVDKTSTLGRGGLAAVFGSKNLKAIVTRGTKGVRVADRKRFKKVCDQMFERIKNYPALKECHEMGFLKQMPVMPKEVYLEKFKKRRISCVGCPIGDKDILQIKEGRFEGLVKYATSAINTVISFLYGITDYFEAVKLLDILDGYGLDMFEAFGLLKFADNLYKQGIITSGDLGSEGIEFNYDSVADWFGKIAHREGFGDVLADGFDGVVAKYGEESEKFAPSISKGLTAYMGVKGPLFWDLFGTMEFGMAVHMRGPAAAPGGSTPLYSTRGRPIEWIKMHMDRVGIPADAIERILSGKDGMKINVGRFEKYGQEFFFASACLGTCVRAHINRFYSNKIHAEMFSSATGIETTGAELLKAAERGYNLLKMANVREGFSRTADKFPENWFEEPMHMDYYENVKITREIAYKLLGDYYDERGWDIETGIPTEKKLRELGLDYAIKDIS